MNDKNKKTTAYQSIGNCVERFKMNNLLLYECKYNMIVNNNKKILYWFIRERGSGQPVAIMPVPKLIRVMVRPKYSYFIYITQQQQQKQALKKWTFK